MKKVIPISNVCFKVLKISYEENGESGKRNQEKVEIVREGLILDSRLSLGKTKSQTGEEYRCYYYYLFLPSCGDDCGYSSNAVWNHTSTELSIHHTLECVCRGTSEGLLPSLPAA